MGTERLPVRQVLIDIPEAAYKSIEFVAGKLNAPIPLVVAYSCSFSWVLMSDAASGNDRIMTVLMEQEEADPVVFSQITKALKEYNDTQLATG